MEISKGLQLEIRSVQSKLKNAIRDHQICVGKLKDDPNNADILERIQEIQVHIVSLGRCQKQVVQRLRKEVDDYKAANANEVKVSVATLLGINNNNHITANNESTNDDISEVKVVTNGLDNVRLINAKEDYEDSVRNGEVTSPRENLLKKERSISVETLSADDEEVIEVTMDDNTRETKRQMSEEPLDERKIKCTEQLSFLEVLGLITTLRSTELQNRRAERKRRSTANPQFVYSNWEMPTKRKRHSYLQSAGNVPQTRQTTARLNGPSPPPICNKSANSIVPPKSTSPPTRTSSKSLIPIQKASTRPNILRNMSESRVFPNKNNRIENGNGQLQLSSLTTKISEPTTNSKAVHIPGLPSGLTIERIEHDSAVCINCRNPGTLTSCDNCEANYHVSCHSISPPPPSICPKCAIKMKYSTGGIKKNDELVAASYAPGVAGKAGQDPEINKASGGFYKIGPNAKQQQQQRQTVTGECGINESSGASIVEPIPSKPIDESDYVIAAIGGSEVYLVGSNGVDVTEKGSLPSSKSNAIDVKVSGARVPPVSGVGYVRNFSFSGDTRTKKIIEESRIERGSNERERIVEQSVSRRNECNDESGKVISGNEPGIIESKIDADVNGVKFTGSIAESIPRGPKKSTIRAIPGLTRIVSSIDFVKSQPIKTEHSDNDNMGELQRGKYVCSEKFVDSERNDNERKFGKYENAGEPSRKEQTTSTTTTTTTESLFSRDKHRPKFGSILHSLFTGYNKPDSISLRNDESRNATSSSRDNEIFGGAREQRYQERANDDISGRRKIVGSGEHVKLEEAHLSAPSRAMLMRDIDDNVEQTRNEDRARRIFAGGAMFSARRRTTEDDGPNFAQRGIRDYGRNERRQLPRILMRTERKSLESRDPTSNDKANYLLTFGNNSRSLLKMPEEETTKVLDNDCNSGGDTSATEDANSPIMFPDDGQSVTKDDRKIDVERENGDDVVNNEDDNNTRDALEIDEETDDNEEIIDDEEHQDCPIVDDDIRQGANLGVRIGTISPESMKVLELFENAMMQVENGDKTANP